MKAYKCDICEKLFEEKHIPILPTYSSRQLLIAFNGTNLNAADICPDCLEEISDIVRILSPTEENDDSKRTETDTSEIS